MEASGNAEDSSEQDAFLTQKQIELEDLYRKQFMFENLFYGELDIIINVAAEANNKPVSDNPEFRNQCFDIAVEAAIRCHGLRQRCQCRGPSPRVPFEFDCQVPYHRRSPSSISSSPTEDPQDMITTEAVSAAIESQGLRPVCTATE